MNFEKTPIESNEQQESPINEQPTFVASNNQEQKARTKSADNSRISKIRKLLGIGALSATSFIAGTAYDSDKHEKPTDSNPLISSTDKGKELSTEQLLKRSDKTLEDGEAFLNQSDKELNEIKQRWQRQDLERKNKEQKKPPLFAGSNDDESSRQI